MPEERGAPLDRLRARLAAAEPTHRGQEPSAARVRIREAFEDIAAARDRGLSWQQVTDALAAEGMRAADGGALTWRKVKALFHVERYARGGKRKRQPGLVPDPDAPRFRRRRAAHSGAAEAVPAAAPKTEAAPPNALPAEGGETQAQELRALLARRRPALRDPSPVTLGPADRRPNKESEDDA
jgi:hypothetical protein